MRQELRDGDRDVAGAGGKIKEENVEVTPEHIGKELLKCPVQHGSAPHHRLAVGHEHPDRYRLHLMRDWGQQHVVKAGGLTFNAEHSGN